MNMYILAVVVGATLNLFSLSLVYHMAYKKGESKMNDETLERLGQIVDKSENYLIYREMAVTSDLKISALLNGLTEIRNEVKQLYFDLGGEDVWPFEV